MWAQTRDHLTFTIKRRVFNLPHTIYYRVSSITITHTRTSSIPWSAHPLWISLNHYLASLELTVGKWRPHTMNDDEGFAQSGNSGRVLWSSNHPMPLANRSPYHPIQFSFPIMFKLRTTSWLDSFGNADNIFVINLSIKFCKFIVFASLFMEHHFIKCKIDRVATGWR